MLTLSSNNQVFPPSLIPTPIAVEEVIEEDTICRTATRTLGREERKEINSLRSLEYEMLIMVVYQYIFYIIYFNTLE